MIQAVALLVGTIVGAGVFAMPYAASQSGFLIAAAWLVVLSLVMTVLHLMEGEILLRTQEIHRLPGYARKYMSARAGLLLLASEVVGLSATLLVYMVLGAAFLDTLVPGNQPRVLLAVLFWVVFSAPAFVKLGFLAYTELVLTGILIVVLAGISFFLIPKIEPSFLLGLNTTHVFLPYGVTLFALSGISAVPLVRAALGKNPGMLKPVIMLGTLIPAVLFGVFMLSVVGITGPKTSPDAISGLAQQFGYPVVFIGALAGFLAVATSFITIAAYVRDELRFDLGLPKTAAWAALVIPLVLYLVGVRNIAAIAAFAGTMIGAVDGSLIALMWKRARATGDRTPEYALSLPKVFAFGIIALCVGAAASELILGIIGIITR